MVTVKQQNWYGWYVVFISAMIGVSMTASFPQFTMIVGEYAEQLHSSKEFLLFTDTVRSISIMVAMLISGPVYQRMGLKKTFVAAIASMLLPQIFMPYITSAAVVLLLKIVQGFCAVIFPIFLITIMSWMDKSNSGTATAVFNGIFYGGSGIGAAVAGFTISALGWKPSFYVIALMTLIPSVLWFFTVKEKRTVLPGDPSEGNVPAETSSSGKVSSDGKDRTFQELVRSPGIWALIVCLFSTIWMVQVLSVDLPLYGSALQYDAEAVGLFMSSLAVGIFLACVISGRISDYFSQKSKDPATARLIVFSIGPVLSILSILLLLVIDKSSFPLFYSAILLLSFSSAWGLGAFYCILPEIMEPRKVEYATGLIGGIADIGMPVGPLLFGVVFGVKGLWTGAWISCIAVCLISAFASIAFVQRMRSKRISG